MATNRTNHPDAGPDGNSASSGAYAVGQVLHAASARLECKVTTPPDRYTQDTLLDDMVNAHKFAEDDEDRKMLKATEGLGTSRTRIATITKLLSNGLLETRKAGKRWQVQSTPMARDLLDNLPPEMTSVVTTARWETALAAIRAGKVDPQKVIDYGYASVSRLVEHARSLKATGSASGSAQKPDGAVPVARASHPGAINNGGPGRGFNAGRR